MAQSNKRQLLTDGQLLKEISRCEFCEEKPCQKACPAGCSPADFIMAAKLGKPLDFERSAKLIIQKNPFGGTCGQTCINPPCMKKCVHNNFDNPINISLIQATILSKAPQEKITLAPSGAGKQIAIIGAGPAGLSAAVSLANFGHNITVFEKTDIAGGAINYISEKILDKRLLENDLAFILSFKKINIIYKHPIYDYEALFDLNSTECFDGVIVAIGNNSEIKASQNPKIIFAGDCINGRTTVVKAVASGKNAAKTMNDILNNNIAHISIFENTLPVKLNTTFFDREIISPFLLSAAPTTDGYEQIKKAYLAGWAGAIVKTAFDNLPIHIPAEYMFNYCGDSFANCDNVSARPLDISCDDIKKLIKEFPDRLTIGGTGGSVTGNDEIDKKSWQSNTKKLESAGAMAIEYSLSCPQGSAGKAHSIVSQDPEMTAKVIDWVMEISNPSIPKLFKLTSAVTSIEEIIYAVKKVFAKYPNKKAGITLANSFPTLALREQKNHIWDEGIVAGMAGEAVKNISYLSIAKIAKSNITISGNGGIMNYKTAADFLALGCKTVQACSLPMKYGVGIIDELHSGLSYLLKSKGFKNISELIGCACENPITQFLDLSPIKKHPVVNRDLCRHCGNCTRCGYLAISLDNDKIPVVDKSKCVGCSFCTLICFAKALSMKD